MSDIWQWDTATTAQQVATGEISAREVTDAHLARLDAVNPQLNAVTNDVREHALAAAAERDAAQAAGHTLGPLHGVPITIKENIDVIDQPTPNGLPALADTIATADSPLVSHLQEAGAVIIGRTNTPEMSYRWHTENPLRGETKNPWSSERTPGGSSGGAASAVAAGIGTIAHGNDLGGSVRQPANCCGLVGLRPSLGRIPAFNHTAPAERSLGLQLMSVQGPLGRKVADVRAAFNVMAQPSPDDPWHIAAPTTGSPLVGPIRVAATYGGNLIETDPAVKQAIDTAAAHLADAGYQVDFVDPPHLEEIMDGWQAILATETSVTVIDQLASITSDDFQRILGWMFAEDVFLDLAGYVQAYADRSRLLRMWTRFLHEQPLVLSPVSQLLPFAPNDDASSQERFTQIAAGHAPLVAVNYLGLPAVAVPSILDASGPVGVQLIGRPLREDLCLDAAQAIEDRVGVMTDQLWAQL
ncbi:UNVERIFIED_CONTAM: hypothetical protein GTU68_008277 [Idotea baltica]|nr:hypothetical protein [Idotea baltica]